MRHSFSTLFVLAIQLTSFNPARAVPHLQHLKFDSRSLNGTNATSPVNQTIPVNAYPTSLANWTASDTNLTDEARNPYHVGLDEIPLVNQSSIPRYGNHSLFNSSHANHTGRNTYLSYPYNFTGLHFNYNGSVSAKNDLRKRYDKVLLRIMPLGASITQGIDTVDHPDPADDNGYRLELREWLRYNGWDVNYVGSKSNGQFADNENEGHPGYQIAAVMEAMDPVMSEQKPNLVLINAGTNDCVQADDPTLTPTNTGLGWVQTIPDRLRTMIDRIYAESEGVTVILSTLLPNYTPGNAGPYVEVANEGIRKLYAEYQAAGAKMKLAEMDAGWWSYPSDFSDVTHPNTGGYSKMASIWTGALQEVFDAGFLVAPIDTGLGDDKSGSGTCIPTASSFASAMDTVTFDVGANDGTYSHSSTLQIKGGLSDGSYNKSLIDYHQYHFAQMVSVDDTGLHARDEMILILDVEDRAFAKKQTSGTAVHYMQYKYNKGNGVFDDDWTEIDIVGQGTPECLSRGVRFGDINGDGLDDFICINPKGSPFVSLNRGGNPPTFEFIGQIYSDRFAQADVRLGDIDGDGRLDYCGFDPDGSGYCHRNGGTGDAPTSAYGGYWQGILLGAGGPTWQGLVDEDGEPITNEEIRFVDINGDGRADMVAVDNDGATIIYINQRGDKTDGLGLKPHWVRASTAHLGFPGDNTMTRDNILFGRIYGSGRADYIRLYEYDFTELGFITYEFSIWENTGSGGRKVNGDGVRFCDIDGDGKDDLIYIWEGGMVDWWERGGSDDAPTWTSKGRIVELNHDRKFVHFADWNGDGLCDILYVDRATGSVTYYENFGESTWFFSGGLSVVGGLCPQAYSPSLTDLAVRFGDLDGDGRADYLCMDPNGRTVGWLNKESGLSALNQIKVSVGFDRGNHRWADVDGDGNVDFIWIDKHTGNVQFWINNGFIPSLGSSMNWIGYTSSWRAGAERGQNIQFPRMRANSKRADYHVVMPRTGRGITYDNNCGDGGVGPGPDSGAGAVDPGLPKNPYGNGDGGGGGGGVICSRATKCGKWPDYPRVIALGDSYAAGIGAGNHLWGTSTGSTAWDETGSCFLGTNANTKRLFEKMYEPDDDKTLEFLACTGDKSPQIYQEHSGKRSNSQLGYLDTLSNADYNFITLSIGGNDVGFSSVAIWCLTAKFSQSTCDKHMEFAEKSVGSGAWAGQAATDEYNTLYNNLVTTWRAILNKPATPDTWFIVYGYGRFFNDADQTGTAEDCATRSLTLFNTIGPKLTVDIRVRVNNAITAMNALIQTGLSQMRSEFPQAKIRFVDIDQFLDGHRWCEQDAKGQLYDFGDAWFFRPEGNDNEYDPSTSSGSSIVSRGDGNSDSGPTFDTDYDCSGDSLNFTEDQAWYCALQGGHDIDCDTYPQLCSGGRKRQENLIDQYHVMKAFHPKSTVHIQAANYIVTNYFDWQLDSDGCPCDV